jgi:hypothetical protein
VNNGVIDAEYASLREALTTYLRQGGKLAVVKTPPGSGKTHTLIEVLSTLVSAGMRIAVAAQTNSQVDDICQRWARAHPEIPVARFSSSGAKPDEDFPASVLWVTDKKELPTGRGISIATTAKWSLTDLADAYDVLAIDEAWQMSWADLMQCATVSDRFLMIGDPGQIPPVVTIDARRWDTSPRAPHEAAPEVVLHEPSLESVRFVGSLPACRRLPYESVDFIRPFYDFPFAAYVAPRGRGVELPYRWGEALANGRPVALTIPTPDHGPPVQVDPQLAAVAAEVVSELLSGKGLLRAGSVRRAIAPGDIGVTSSHRVMNSALASALGSGANQVRVDTPERWQGLERPIMIAVHPLSGTADPSAFDVGTGRLCVMASRHQAGLIMLTRNHVGETLRNYVPSAGQAPGRPDTVGRGHDAHLRFWAHLEANDSVVPFI